MTTVMNNEKNNQLRLFVSIDMPIAVQEIITSIQQQLKESTLLEGTFVKSADAHLTLHFLGSVAVNKIPSIIQALEHIQMPVLQVCLGNIGVFRTHQQINIIYLDLINPTLAALAKQINTQLAEFVTKEERQWMSHVTIARIKKVYDRLTLLSILEAIKLPNVCFEIQEFLLKQSVLSSEGPSYTILARFRFQ